MADSVTGQTVVDPKGYLTDMKSIKISSDAEISDIKKARLLLKSVTNTNPRHAPGWIAAARLEELVSTYSIRLSLKAVIPHLAASLQHIEELRNCLAGIIIRQAPVADCGETPVVVQAGKQSQARLLLQKGCEFCPTGDDIWLEASRMQSNPDSAKAMLARGVAALPNSIKLWLQV
jgi:pre-mRNA-processing factor 6